MPVTYVIKAEQDGGGGIVLQVVVGERHTIRLSQEETRNAMSKRDSSGQKAAIADHVERTLRNAK